MSWFTKWAFGNKAAVIFLTVLILIVGLVSYRTLPMEFFPAADQPQVTVIVMGQGTDSKTMESQVTGPIETAVSGVKGKSDVFSTSGDGFTKVDIMFDSKTDMKAAKQEVQEALNNTPLPQNVSKPTVVQLNTSMIPISDISLTFKDGLTPENTDFAKEEILPYFKDIKGVANVQTYGASSAYVSIKTDNAKMAENKVSLQNVMAVLKGQNSSIAVGEKQISGKTSNIKVVGSIDSLDKVKNLKVSENVTLSEIAQIEIKKPQDTLTRVNGEDGLIFIVTKDSLSNAVSISNEIKDAAKEINKKYDHVNAHVLIATADMVETSVNTMIKEVLLGAVFATIVVMLFLRNIRSTLITIVSIPLSLCLTLFLLARSGVTLNILTLGGVAVAVGRLVDDSIVVIENIFRKMQNQKFSTSMVIEATKEVGTAITSSTLTTVAVFLPIGLVSGGLQDIILPFALTITYSLLASLLVALTVVPLLSYSLLKKAKLPEHKPSIKFTNLVRWSLNHKWVIILTSLVMFGGSIGTYAAMPKGAVNNSSADFIIATLDFPNDTPIETVKEKTIELENYVLKQDHIKDLFIQLGNTEDAAKFGEVQSPTKATFNILLKDKEYTDTVIKRINSQKEAFGSGKLTAGASSMMGGSKTQIIIDVIGDDISKLEAATGAIEDGVSGIKGVEKVGTNQDAKKTVYSLNVDPEKGNAEEISQALYGMLNKMPLGTMKLDDQQTDIFLEPILDPKTPEDLKNMPLMTKAGMVPASSLAAIVQEETSTFQYRKNGDTYIRITADVKPELLSEINGKINKFIFGNGDKKGLKLDEGIEVLVGGASAQQAEDFTDLFTIMLVSIGLVFLIMIITFKTFRAPIAILCTLPLAAIGAIIALLISGIPVDPTGLLGALMLIGIVVTNAIVLLDRVKQNEKTMIIREAIVEAAAIRMRPILMTAIATICAMLPMLFKEAETGSLVSQSLAVVVIGGLAVATLLTLIVIPVIYELLHFKKSKKQRLNASQLEKIA
ncbi:HAE1 family hydrophobic/amphiphilic exporter-1 [Peribacillus deserti]|uniref:HAE1 family hydrophobic/amphiphilic exporter-1 n=1 Tax=Peribacillus deserti TaxID=673318 RepID=A0ABS2QM18_9BACI|nr:efflux RND transporter permease subunit [Peribacillus deserti]MBM7694220.1 HAE1 family hydrophobic/amphiphilic exporter-1 [Peribacillus deserti]